MASLVWGCQWALASWLRGVTPGCMPVVVRGCEGLPWVSWAFLCLEGECEGLARWLGISMGSGLLVS